MSDYPVEQYQGLLSNFEKDMESSNCSPILKEPPGRAHFEIENEQAQKARNLRKSAEHKTLKKETRKED